MCPSLARADEAPEERARLRVGFNLGGGGLVAPVGSPGASFGLRLGVQINRLIGVYYQGSPQLFGGVLVSGPDPAPGGPRRITSGGLAAVGIVRNSAMVSVTPVDPIEIAVGPSIDYASYSRLQAAPSGAETVREEGPAFGVGGRVAVHIGGRNPDGGRRTSFALGLDPHVTMAPTPIVTLTGGLGVEWY